MKMSFIIPVYRVDLRQLDACIDSIEVAAAHQVPSPGKMVHMRSLWFLMVPLLRGNRRGDGLSQHTVLYSTGFLPRACRRICCAEFRNSNG